MDIKTEPIIAEVIGHFSKYGELTACKPITNGHINDTYITDFKTSNGTVFRYLLQRINTAVFKKPDELMQNIIGVTEHLKKKIRDAGGDETRETLTVFCTDEGECFYTASDGSCWRLYNFVDNTFAINELTNANDFRNAALSFGNFQKQLADYPAESLYETIPNFHNTPSRLNDLKTAVKKDAVGRKNTVEKEIAFALSHEKDCGIVTDLLEKGEIPLRVTHNDTKLNNVLFDNESKKGICVVDLDTVMPGSSLYDFGDSIRSGANTGAEDDKDLAKVSLNLEYFKAYVDGYLESAGESLTDKEIELLPFSAGLMTLECGVRFLEDYLNGDTYFKTDYPEHNLVRARSQFKLVEDIERKYTQMQEIVGDLKKSEKI